MTDSHFSDEYDFRLEEVCAKIERAGAARVGIQLPEGLKRHGPAVAGRLRELCGAESVISGDPCYGACDPALDLLDMGCDLIVNFGHAELPGMPIESDAPVLFVELAAGVDVAPVTRKAAVRLAGKGTVGLVTTIQHVAALPVAVRTLEEAGLKARVGEPGGRAVHPGQVLGCSFRAATSIADEVSVFLFIGSGHFHPLGVALASGKDVVVADPYVGEVVEINDLRERILRQRHAAITRAGDAADIGIIVGTKPGQRRLKLALKLESMAREKGRRACTIALKEMTGDALENLGLDAYVSTLCPRAAIDDYFRFKVPVLTPQEFEILLGERDWEDYVFDEFH